MRSSGDPAHLSSETGTLFVFFTGGIVFLTLILNGSTTQFVLHFLRMDRLSSAKRRILEYTKFEMQKMALEAFRDLGEDEELGPADWPTVKRYIKSLGNIEEEGVQSDTSESVGPHAQMDLKDIRVRLLNGVQAAYWVMLDEGRISEGESEIASIVINESEAEGEEARNFLEDVRSTFPEVLRVVKTRQATHAVLKHVIHYVSSLEKAGLLEEREMLHLHEAVQFDLKRLTCNPPLVKIPKIKDLISTHPLLGALPAEARLHLVGSTKDLVKMRGVTLYKEGSRPNGIWLISNGVVKWASRTRSKLGLHPTFTHGSTLGLYEVMIGKPYLCDMIVDSVLVCFFVETERVQSLLASHPEVEDFFWKESVTVLAKILLPPVFGKMSMQDLRVLIAESSELNIYLSGESVEVPPHSIGFLLEGFLKSHSVTEDLIAAPAALWPGKGNASFLSHDGSGYHRSTSFYHQGATYHVATRARVIVFDMGAPQTGHGFQRQKSSFLVPDQSTTSFVREHGSFLTWPEHNFKPEHHQGDKGGNELSATAMQLSIFGSKVDLTRRGGHNLGGNRLKKPSTSLSLSYPRVPVKTSTLTSVRSESSATVNQRLLEELTGIEAPLVPPPAQSHSRKPSHMQESSDDSGPEDEVIVRIDSPSRLSFQQGA